MSGEQGIEQVASLLEFFRDELTLAFEHTGVETSEETEAYLVHLLDGYMRLDPDSAEEVGFDKPAAVLLEEAMYSAGDRRIEIYRRLGDASLYNCGFFAERLNRRVGPSYYRRLGRTAYQSLGDMMGFKQPGGVFQAIYDELAAKFDNIVDAFRMLSGTQAESPAESELSRLLAGGLQPVTFDEN
jgi:hypothetical protein